MKVWRCTTVRKSIISQSLASMGTAVSVPVVFVLAAACADLIGSAKCVLIVCPP